MGAGTIIIILLILLVVGYVGALVVRFMRRRRP
jgi:hypothetical protein